MTAFILKRLGLALITLWILSLIVFFLGQILPGDPGRSILGPLAAPSAVKTLYNICYEATPSYACMPYSPAYTAPETSASRP